MNRVGIVGMSGVIAFVLACSTSSEEPQGTSVQYFSGEGGECAHPICQTGQALDPSCDPCTTDLCAQDPYCCNVEWDATCVGEVTSICGQSCLAQSRHDAGPSTCSHPICATGVALASTCESCAGEVCEQDPYCCTVMWDATCVGEVTSICGQACN